MQGIGDSFYLTLTSSGSRELFPNNKPGDFSMQFSRQFILDNQGWEVGLHTLTYPFEFNTVGDGAQVHFRYDNDVFLLELPPWHCSDVTEMCAYLTEQMSQQVIKSEFVRVVAGNEYGEGNSLTRYSRSTYADQRAPIVVSADATRRVTFAFATPFADLGLSDRLLEMLGLSNQPRFGLKQFSQRQKTFMTVREKSREKRLKFSAMTRLENLMNASKKAKYSTKFFEATGLLVGTKIIPTPQGENDEKNGVPEDNEPGKGPPKLSSGDLLGEKELERFLREMTSFDEEETDAFMEHLNKVMETQHEELVAKYPKTKFSAFESRQPRLSEFQIALTTFEFSNFLRFYKISDDGTLRGNLPANMNPFELMYIYSDIVKPEPFDNMMIAMLEIVKTEGSQGTLSQYRATSNIQYKAIDRSNISNIRILIASDQGQPIPFMREPLVITLHFRRRAAFH